MDNARQEEKRRPRWRRIARIALAGACLLGVVAWPGRTVVHDVVSHTKTKPAGSTAPYETFQTHSALRVARVKMANRATQRVRTPLDWVLPVRSYHLTGRFGQDGDRWASFHHGLDFAAPEGTPVTAVAAGTIIAAGWDTGYGRRIKVRHHDGTVTLYAHLSAFEQTSGDVRPGTVIGYVGMSGNATGPHVHLEVRPDGGDLDSAVDPYAWLVSKGLRP